MKKPTEYKNFINGKWVKSYTGESFRNINPANTEDVVGIFQKPAPGTSTMPSALLRKRTKVAVYTRLPNAAKSYIVWLSA